MFSNLIFRIDLGMVRWSKGTVAVMTGSNKGIGYEVVRQLAPHGLTVVLTARDTGRGLAALEALKAEGFQSVFFHQLDVTDAVSIKASAVWLKEQFGGIDILVNNVGVQKMSDTYEHVVETMETNYFGVKNITNKLLPCLEILPMEPKFYITPPAWGNLSRFTKGDFVKNQLSDLEKLSEDAIDALARKYLNDVKEG